MVDPLYLMSVDGLAKSIDYDSGPMSFQGLHTHNKLCHQIFNCEGVSYHEEEEEGEKALIRVVTDSH